MILCISVILFSFDFNLLISGAEELTELGIEEIVDIASNGEKNDDNLDDDLGVELFEDDKIVFNKDEELEEVEFLVGASNGITTAAIDNICSKYGYANGKYWTYNGSLNQSKYTASTTAAGTNGYQGYSYPLNN